MGKLTFNKWLLITAILYLIIQADINTVQVLGIFGSGLIMVAWVTVGLIVLRPKVLKNFIRGQQPDMSDEDVALLSEAKKIVDNLVLSLNLKLTNIEYAQLVQENLWKLRGEEEK
ncbi:MAG: hypothetical protein COC22_00145 [Flavobacteriaceae bacterium]|nr:MAG: hypothetical protein COC22_00145 [Flavobacteriaceae bacterium]